jgi:hypothetical protein
MGSDRRLLQLSTLIQDNTATVDAYIKENGISQPSFDPSNSPVLHFPPEVDVARNTALEALDELRDHLLGPVGSITNAVTDVSCYYHYTRGLADND